MYLEQYLVKVEQALNSSIMNYSINQTIGVININLTQQTIPYNVDTIFINSENVSVVVINSSNYLDNINESLDNLDDIINFSPISDNMDNTVNQDFESLSNSVNDIIQKISNTVTTVYEIIKEIVYLIFESDKIDDLTLVNNNTPVYYDPNMVAKQISKCVNDTK